MHLDVLTYNIHKGFSTFNQDFILHELKNAIKETKSDVVFLQEVIGFHAGHAERVSIWPEQPQFEYLADSVWDHYAYGKNAVYSEGHHGNAILSKFPILWWEQQDISTNAVEQRGLLHCVLEDPESKIQIHCVCVHLSLFSSARSKQLEYISERIKEHVPQDAPLIVAGDTNDWRDVATRIFYDKLGMTEVFAVKTGHTARSFPCRFPVLPLDRIYTRGFHVAEVECLSGSHWSKLSDHAALRARLEIK